MIDRTKMTAKDLAALDGVKKPSKYRARVTVYNGVKYASKKEAERAKELDLAKLAGRIWFWTPQPIFRLGCPENIYRADFLVVCRKPEATHVEDTKGYRVAKFNRDVKLWREYGPCDLHVIGDGVTEVIKGKSNRR